MLDPFDAVKIRGVTSQRDLHMTPEPRWPAYECPPAGSLRVALKADRAWDAIEAQLRNWEDDPGQLEDDALPPPSMDTIRTAIQVAADLRGRGAVAPSRVIADAHGGIVFELSNGSIAESLHIEPDRSIEHRFLVNHRLMKRAPWILDQA